MAEPERKLTDELPERERRKYYGVELTKATERKNALEDIIEFINRNLTDQECQLIKKTINRILDDKEEAENDMAYYIEEMYM